MSGRVAKQQTLPSLVTMVMTGSRNWNTSVMFLCMGPCCVVQSLSRHERETKEEEGDELYWRERERERERVSE